MTKFSLLPYRKAKLNVGLLGGSFNPVHKGHLYITEEAIKRFNLDFVIWLISPQNPLKSASSYLSIKKRLAQAKSIAKHPKIKVSTIEEFFSSNYTYCTLHRLTKMHPETNFVWIMGSDNLGNFSDWYRWQDIPKIMPVIVFERGDDLYKIMKAKAVAHFNLNVVADAMDGEELQTNNLYLVRIKKNNLSSTMIRSTL